jgi:hypothetical protein
MAPLYEQDALGERKHASSAFSETSVQNHASDDFRRLIDELASIISRSAEQRDQELDKELETRPFTPPEPHGPETGTLPSPSASQQPTTGTLRRRQLTDRHVVLSAIAVAVTAVLLLGGMIYRVWFAGLRNDPPPQLAFDTAARVPTSSEVAEQPQSTNQKSDRADSPTLGLKAVSLQQLDDEQIAALIKVGRELIGDGKIPPARLALQRAASAGSAPAALELGGTYDPIILERLGATGMTEMVENIVVLPDTALARAWYQTAKDLGSGEAQGRLEKLARRSGRPR